MDAPNKYLGLMTKDRPVLKTWRSLGAFVLPVSTFDAPHQQVVLDFLTETPDTYVRYAEIHFLADSSLFFTEFLIEGLDSQEALNNSVISTLGGLICARISPIDVEIHDMHLAPLLELRNNSSLRVENDIYGVRDRAIECIRNIRSFYEEAA